MDVLRFADEEYGSEAGVACFACAGRSTRRVSVKSTCGVVAHSDCVRRYTLSVRILGDLRGCIYYRLKIPA